jgi:hypothetical protein
VKIKWTADRLQMSESERAAAEAKGDELLDRIRPLLGGHHPAVQGYVVADLVAMWIAGHHVDVRDEIRAKQFDFIRELEALHAKVLWRGR